MTDHLPSQALALATPRCAEPTRADQGMAAEALEALECPICMTLPEGEVHQCNEGHCYCVDCWRRLLDPRRCPECRQPVPQANRNRAAERAIAALEATCEHCDAATTRGTKAAHMCVCPQRPTVCAAAAAGCSWTGVAAEQTAHETSCLIAVCQRLMEPLQVQCDGLQTQCGGLQARCDVLQARCGGLQTRCGGFQAQKQQLQVQNQQLQAQNEQLHAHNQQLLARVTALEGDEEADGPQKAAPHDAPPSDVAVEEMELVEAVAALRTHVTVARVAEKICARLEVLCRPDGSEQAAADAGALEAVVAALCAHPQVAAVQVRGCTVLTNVCGGHDAAGPARKQRAADAEALEAVVNAMRAHPQVAAVQWWGCEALDNVCCGDDTAGRARSQRAADAEALEAVVAALCAHPQVAYVQEWGCGVLSIICGGRDAAGLARRQRAAQVGGGMVAAAAMKAHPTNGGVQDYGHKVLGFILLGSLGQGL